MTNILLALIALLIGSILYKLNTWDFLRYKGTMLEDNGFWSKPEPMKYAVKKKAVKSKKGTK